MANKHSVLDVLKKFGISVRKDLNGVITTEESGWNNTIACGQELLLFGFVPRGQLFKLEPVSGNMCCCALEIHLNNSENMEG